MAVKTTLEQLEEVQEAITRVMTSQEQSGAGRSIVRAQLSALQDREEKLLARYRAENRTGGPASCTGIPRRD